MRCAALQLDHERLLQVRAETESALRELQRNHDQLLRQHDAMLQERQEAQRQHQCCNSVTTNCGNSGKNCKISTRNCGGKSKTCGSGIKSCNSSTLICGSKTTKCSNSAKRLSGSTTPCGNGTTNCSNATTNYNRSTMRRERSKMIWPRGTKRWASSMGCWSRNISSCRGPTKRLGACAADLAVEAASDRHLPEEWVAEREMLIGRLADAETRLSEVDPNRVEDLEQRREMAVADVRDLKRRNAELEESLARAGRGLACGPARGAVRRG